MDFHQGPLATLHDIRQEHRGYARALVERSARDRPAALVLPMVADELDRPALAGIRTGLKESSFLHQVVVPLTTDTDTDVERTQRFFSELKVPVDVLWCEGPKVREVLDSLRDRELDLTHHAGKGIAVWLAIGAAQQENYAIALHDADIEDYSPRLLSRLLFPILVRDADYYFAKGFYARVTNDRLYGRATRLFLWPFLDALEVVLGDSPTLRYLRAFRYPLSGEMAMTSDLAVNLRIPTDWGLEIGILSEVYRNVATKRICQVDLGLYSHKHKKVGSGVHEGLRRMTHDIATSVLRVLTEVEGVRIDAATMLALRVAYKRQAQDSIRKYHVDSLYNDYRYDRHGEEATVEAFAEVVEEAGRRYTSDPGREQIPDWLRVLDALPDADVRLRMTARDGDRLRAAAAEDTTDAKTR